MPSGSGLDKKESETFIFFNSRKITEGTIVEVGS